jgi:hypothetical protein
VDQWEGQRWFDSYDCASFVLRVVKTLASVRSELRLRGACSFCTCAQWGVQFDLTTPAPKYTFITLYSEQPEMFMNHTDRACGCV